jgi:hypothetical protein
LTIAELKFVTPTDPDKSFENESTSAWVAEVQADSKSGVQTDEVAR